jgi:PGF-pre-PGF domain-containing protein
LPGYITVTDTNGSSSSGGGGSVSTGTGSLAGTGGSPEPASNIAVKLQTQKYIAAGNHIKFEFTQGATCIDCVEFDAMRTLGKTTTTIEQLKERSVLAPADPAGKVYKYLNIWVGNSGIATSENIENATVKFVINKAEIEMNETEEPTIVLQRYEQGIWSPLNTIKTEEDEQYICYQANTPGFSTFAITSDEIKPIEEDVSQLNGKNVSQPILNNELSIQSKQPGKSEAAGNIDWSKYSGIIRFFILFIVVLFIGLALKEKRK